LLIKSEIYIIIIQIFRKDKNRKYNNCILILENILKI